MHTGYTQQHTQTYQRGFTFVETLVAITVLVMAVVGPMYLSSQGLRAARIARDQINANYLAQEGIEYIRYRRDNNVLAGSTWLTGLELCKGDGCTIDIWTDTIAPCTVGEECPILMKENTGQYGYGDGSTDEWLQTKFTRWISVQETSPEKEALVSVTISWQDGMLNRQHTLTETLQNWQ